jgi:hypothetical protein
MRHEYRLKESAAKLLRAKDLRGLPGDITLSFSNAYVRFYKSRGFNGFFYCTLAVPSLLDDEGYVLELEFDQEQPSDEDIDFSTYLAPLNDHDFDSLAKAAECYFQEIHDMGRRMLLLYLKIHGTPYFGHVYIDASFYIK